MMLDTIWRDLVYAARMLRKSPAFTFTAVLTLALTIGANTAVFSMVDRLLLRPLPYPEPERLAMVSLKYDVPARGLSGSQLSHDGKTWQLLSDHATRVDLAVYSEFDLHGGVNLVTSAGPMFVRQQRVGAGFFRVLGVPPLVGREFTTAEDVPNGARVAVLSHALWRKAFGGDRDVIGRSVMLKGEPFTIVGVMPEEFRASGPVDLFTPIRASTTGEGEGTNYAIVARLRPGATWQDADAEIAGIGADSLRAQQQRTGARLAYGLVPLQDGRTAAIRPQLLVLWAAVGVVLIIACLNIAGLLLARGGTRRKEIATRLALGGSRGVVIRQLLIESLVIGTIGGVLGLAAGRLGLSLLGEVAREMFGVWEPLAMDGRILAVAALVTIGSALLFGLVPAWQASRVDVQPALAGTGTRGATAAGGWPRRLLIVGEVTLGVVLLVCAGLLVRTFVNLSTLQPGFDPRGLATAAVSLDDARYQDAGRVARLFEDTLGRIRQSPGVEAAAVTLGAPYMRLLNAGFARLDGAEGDATRGTIANLSYITPEFFATLRVPVLSGRTFTSRDTTDAPGVAVVNQEFAKRFFNGEDPTGRRIGTAGAERTIVGLVGNVQSRDPGWGDYGPIAATATIYVPAAQTNGAFLRLVHTWFPAVFVVRGARGTDGLEAAVRAAISSVDPQLPVARFERMEQVQAAATGNQRFMAMLLVVLGGIAALLSAIGIHGLIATSLAERTRELGIRLALGATAGQVMRRLTLGGVALALAGVVLGLVLARSAVNAIRSQLWGVEPADPATFAAVAVLLLAVAALASVLPARRVLRLDPAETLRAE